MALSNRKRAQKYAFPLPWQSAKGCCLVPGTVRFIVLSEECNSNMQDEKLYAGEMHDHRSMRDIAGLRGQEGTT